jgi:hypothetical protein
MYAELYRDFPELVPEGWWSGIGPKGPWFECDECLLDYSPPPWFLTLALATIRDWLEGKGWTQRALREADGSISSYQWDKFKSNDCARSSSCPHRAAIAAVRMVKEQA